MRSLLSFILFLLLIHPALAAGLLPDTLEYSVIRNGSHLGVTSKTFSVKDSQVEVQSVTHAEGFLSIFFPEQLTETSRFTLTDSAITPRYYSYHKGGNKPEAFDISFDTKAGVIRHSRLGEEKLSKQSQDLLSFQVAMMLDLKNSKQQLDYHIADRKRFSNYQLRPVAKETIKFRDKSFAVDVLEYVNKEKNEKFTFWCAPELNYLPVKSIKTESDGDIIELRMRQYNQQKFYMDNID